MHYRLVLAVMLGAAGPAQATVTSNSDVGFALQHSVEVAMNADEAYALLAAPDRWWLSAHTYSGDAKNLRLDARAGGCFCETVPGKQGKADGSVEHAHILYAAPGQQLRLSGALGPLQSEALTGVLNFTIAPTSAGARVTMTYVVGGYFRTGTAQIATAVDEVMGEQMQGFKRVADATHH